jgi:hypothetical protein
MLTGNKISELDELSSSDLDFYNDTVPIFDASEGASKKINVSDFPFVTGALDGGAHRGNFIPEYFVSGTGFTAFDSSGINALSHVEWLESNKIAGSEFSQDTTGLFFMGIFPASGIHASYSHTGSEPNSFTRFEQGALHPELGKVGINTNLPNSALAIGGTIASGNFGTFGTKMGSMATESFSVKNSLIISGGDIFTTLGDFFKGVPDVDISTGLHQAYFGTGNFNNSNVGPAAFLRPKIQQRIPARTATTTHHGMLAQDEFYEYGNISHSDFTFSRSSVLKNGANAVMGSNANRGPKLIGHHITNLKTKQGRIIKDAVFKINYSGTGVSALNTGTQTLVEQTGAWGDIKFGVKLGGGLGFQEQVTLPANFLASITGTPHQVLYHRANTRIATTSAIGRELAWWSTSNKQRQVSFSGGFNIDYILRIKIVGEDLTLQNGGGSFNDQGSNYG